MKATLELVAANGMAFSVADVAKRSGVHESTVYRRWGAVPDVVSAALLDYSAQTLPVPDTGSLRADLIEFTTALSKYLESESGRAFARALLVDGLAPIALRRRFWRSRFAVVRAMIDAAANRGELRSDVDAQVVLDLIVAPLHMRALQSGRSHDASRRARIVDAVLRGCLEHSDEDADS